MLKRSILLFFLLSVFAVAIMSAEFDVAVDVNSQFSGKIRSAQNPGDFESLSRQTQAFMAQQQKFSELLLAKAVQKHKLAARLSEDLTPPRMINAFIDQLNRVAETRDGSRQMRKILDDLGRANVEDFSGGIGGVVTVDGSPQHDQVIVLAFDSHGYFADKNETDQEGRYTITGLANGDYYVVTWSESYVDELYDNIQAPLHSMGSWKKATLVKVTESITENINFDLESGAQISGRLTDAATGQPLEELGVNITILQSDKPLPLYSAQTTVSNGDYSIMVPVTGDVKIVATAAGYIPSFYSNKMAWEEADIVSIPSYGSEITGIDFALTPDPATASLGGISGKVTPKGAIFPPLIMPAVVAAYSAADTSLVSFGIQLSPIILPYKINNVPPGEYIVYANDYLGDVLGSENYLGAWAGEKVTVGEGEFVENVDIQLPKGGSIAGTVTNDAGSPVDSLMIFAINKDISLTPDVPFLTQFELGIIVTGDDGSYRFTGLPEGQYVLRTFSDYILQFDLEDIENILAPGKHAGKIVDEYYDGVYNILDFGKADSVTVTGTGETRAVNFTLAKALHFVGKVTDAETGLPTRDVSLIALNSSNAYPWWPFGRIDRSGDYTLGPLPPGTYKILAVTGFGRDTGYLTEFYNNKRSFFDADSLQLMDQNLLNIDFALEKGATLQGFVNLAEGMPAGADTLSGMPVIAYFADGFKAGKLASYDFVRFNGGYRLEKLFPGNYKVAVLPMPSSYATTYLGGGDDFEDAASETVALTYGQVSENKNITLEQAFGAIQGKVTSAVDGSPLHQVVVIAYEPSGHAAGIGISGVDLGDEITAAEEGQYVISGLRSGSYFLRTLAVSSSAGLVGQLEGLGNIFDNFDLTNIGGGLNLDLSLDIPIYRDVWYPSFADSIPIDLHELLYGASAYGVPSEYENVLLPIFLPAPFYLKVPGEAQAVAVTEGSVTPGIDFTLSPGEVEDIIDTGVAERENAGIVSDFSVFQNYPNPFNPSTQIEFYLPSQNRINVTIYNSVGKQIKNLAARQFGAGHHSLTWDGTDDNRSPVAAGIYLARIQAGREQQVLKMLLVK